MEELLKEIRNELRAVRQMLAIHTKQYDYIGPSDEREMKRQLRNHGHPDGLVAWLYLMSEDVNGYDPRSSYDDAEPEA